MGKYAGIYNDFAELLGENEAKIIHMYLQGQQITFPKKLYSHDYIMKQIELLYDGTNLSKLATEFGYTERHLRRLMSGFIKNK